jgi:hypothetical protein
MATSQIIYKNDRYQISEGKIAAWRRHTYENLNLKETFSKSALLKFPDIFPADLEIPDIQNAILAQLREDLILGDISHESVVFIIFDSSVMCKFDIKKMLSKARRNVNITNAKFVIIDTHIGQAENGYKMINKQKYPCVNFDVLERNLNILGQSEYLDINVIKTDLLLDNHVLIKLEDAFLANSKWAAGQRNEINDDAQLEILCRLINHIPRSHGIMMSNDKKLLQKAKFKNKASGININGMQMK